MSTYTKVPENEVTVPEEREEILFDRPSLDSTVPYHVNNGNNNNINNNNNISSEPIPNLKPSSIALSQPKDGVFANMAAKPEAERKISMEDSLPPPYVEDHADLPPPFYETTTVITSIDEDGLVLVEGLPVGSYMRFLVNVMISTAFDFMGFLITSLFATSHAARQGARCGLGVTLVRYGFYIRQRIAEAENFYYDPDQFGQETTGDSSQYDSRLAQNEWVAYFLMIIGWFLILRSNAEYIRARRLEAVVAGTVENSV